MDVSSKGLGLQQKFIHKARPLPLNASAGEKQMLSEY
jgi:hypothetical protein